MRKKMDTNKDGAISKQEFLNALLPYFTDVDSGASPARRRHGEAMFAAMAHEVLHPELNPDLVSRAPDKLAAVNSWNSCPSPRCVAPTSSVQDVQFRGNP